MCGIIGAWLPRNKLSDPEFQGIVDVLYHRGPDDTGVMIENDFYLGMRRLSIIDINHGQQPIFNEDKSKVVLFNGEIYNFKNIFKSLEQRGHTFKSQCDTETIIHSLEEGFDRIEDLRGMYAIAYFDRQKQELSLFRDRVGVKPLYYIHIPGLLFAFASEIKGIEKICNTINYKLEINEEAIYHYLSFSNVPQPHTIYKNVYALMPGHHLLFDKGSITISKYWHYQYEPKLNLSNGDIKELVHEKLKESVELRLNSDVPLGLFLSGGLDSSIIAYIASKELGVDLQTFTVGFPEYNSFDESSIARKTANHLGLSNEILPLAFNPADSLENIIDVYDQPFADPSAIPSIAISKLAQQHVKVVLNGDGGDEQFGGYRRYVLARNLDKIPNISFLKFFLGSPDRRSYFGFIYRMLKTSGLNQAEQSIALSADMLLDRHKAQVLNFEVEQSTSNFINNFKGAGTQQSLDRFMHYDRNINLLSGLLVKMDMASSAASIEARSPFLDNKLFEFSSLLGSKYKINGTHTKYILKEIYKDKLPEEVVYGKKKGFEIPLENWLNKEFQPYIQQMFDDRNSGFYQYVSPQFINDLFHTTKYNAFNINYLKYSMLILYLWFKKKYS